MDYSFIIPVYNCKRYLEDCVKSICTVGIKSYEILLVDDGSTDGSGEVCDTLAQKHLQIRVIHQVNGGASAARNRGIREAQGEKILFLDADDSIDPEALRMILPDPRCDEADLVIFGLTFDYYYQGKCYRRDPMFFDFDGVLSKQAWGEAFSQLYAHNSLSPMWNKVFKRDIIRLHQLQLDESMFLYEDFMFVLQYLRHCQNIWNVPQAVYHYRQAEDEGNAKRRLARIDSLPAFLEPIGMALEELLEANPGIPAQQKDAVLQQLYLVLAREKISVSNLTGIGEVCRDFARWAGSHDLPEQASEFQERLQNRKALALLAADKKTALRHKVAVWVKAHGLYR